MQPFVLQQPLLCRLSEIPMIGSWSVLCSLLHAVRAVLLQGACDIGVVQAAAASQQKHFRQSRRCTK